MSHQENTQTNKLTPFALLNQLRDRVGAISAFTLVELLIVILIIGILLAIALPTFLNQQDKANDTSVRTKLNTTYKQAKLESIPAGGITGQVDFANYLSIAEPELAPVHALHGAAQLPDSDPDTVAIIQAENSDLCAGAVSKSGKIFVETMHNGGAPTVYAYDANSGVQPSCDGTGGTVISGPVVELAGTPASDHFVLAAAAGNYEILKNGNLLTSTAYGSNSLFKQDGNLYGVDGSGDLELINPNTGSSNTITPASSFCGGDGLTIYHAPMNAEGGNRVVGIGGGKIAFVCNTGIGGSQIETASLNGANRQVLVPTAGGSYESNLSYSNGTLVYLADSGSTGSPGGTPFAVSTNGSFPGSRQIGSDQQVNGVAVDSTGKVYLLSNDGSIKVGNIDGSMTGQSWTIGRFAWVPAISQDQNSLVFAQKDLSTGDTNIKTLDVGTGSISASGSVPGGDVLSIAW